MHPFNEPMIIDPNTVVNHFSWERNSDAVRAFMNTNRDVMTDPMTQMVSPQDASQESEVVDLKPETGQNFGQDQGEEDTMAAEGVSSGMSLMNVAGLALVATGAYVAVTSLMSRNPTA